MNTSAPDECILNQTMNPSQLHEALVKCLQGFREDSLAPDLLERTLELGSQPAISRAIHFTSHEHAYWESFPANHPPGDFLQYYYPESLPIHIALFNNCPLEIIKMLLDADPERKTLYEKAGFAFHLPLHMACANKNPQVVKLLLDYDREKKSILTRGDNCHDLPLHVACNHTSSPEVVKLLLDADVSKKSIWSTDCFGYLPLQAACIVFPKSPAIVKLLLEADRETVTISDEYL